METTVLYVNGRSLVTVICFSVCVRMCSHIWLCADTLCKHVLAYLQTSFPCYFFPYAFCVVLFLRYR